MSGEGPRRTDATPTTMTDTKHDDRLFEAQTAQGTETAHEELRFSDDTTVETDPFEPVDADAVPDDAKLVDAEVCGN
jgi:hypothetical protein